LRPGVDDYCFAAVGDGFCKAVIQPQPIHTKSHRMPEFNMERFWTQIEGKGSKKLAQDVS
jgi:hypothetical protein